jgi:hypothetical protein
LFFVATEAHIYLDESGDTGWSFALPYPRGGSSRYLVIAASVLPPGVVSHPERLVRNLYKHRLWNSFNEKKWVHMSPSARTAFSIAAADLLARNPDIHLCGIIANKLLVGDHIYRDPTTLYNYMVKRLLLGEMAKHDRVNFRPDPRSLRVDRRLSLQDYLQTELWFGEGVRTQLETVSLDSRSSLNLQFVDMISGAIHAHFEFGETRNWALLEPHLRLEKLNFEG